MPLSDPQVQSARPLDAHPVMPDFAACIDSEGAHGKSADWRAHLASAGHAVEQAPLATIASHGAAVHCTPGGIVAVSVGELCWSDDRWQQRQRDEGPAAALAAAFVEHGRDLLQRLHGSFAFVVSDPARRVALAAIDRIGICSLSFVANAQHLIAGTTPEAVARHPAAGVAIDPQSIHDYLFCHAVPAPRTIYRGVSKLLPAQFIDWRAARVELGFYWRMRYAQRATDPRETLERRFIETLEACVAAAADGEDRSGAFLSGGTDSSTVTGILAGQRAEPIDAYSIGFDAPDFDEMHYAQIAAKRFGIRHHPYYLTSADVAAAITRIASSYDEPFGNASAVPTYFCALRAREDGIRCLLAGDGGDEIFGGNERYAKQRVFEWYSHLPRAVRAGFLEPALGSAAGRIPLLRKAASYVRQARVPLPDRLETYNFLLRDAAVSVFEPEFLRQVDLGSPLALARAVYQRTDGASSIDRMMHLDLKTTLADNDLRKVGRMCALAGVRVRFPLLDDRMVAFSGELPAALRVRGVQLRPFFKTALRDFLPQEIIDKKKHGFGLPFGLWLRSDPPLAEIARASLAAFARRGYLRPQYLEGLLARHDAEHATYYGVMIWVVMQLEQWLQAKRLA